MNDPIELLKLCNIVGLLISQFYLTNFTTDSKQNLTINHFLLN